MVDFCGPVTYSNTWLQIYFLSFWLSILVVQLFWTEICVIVELGPS